MIVVLLDILGKWPRLLNFSAKEIFKDNMAEHFKLVHRLHSRRDAEHFLNTEGSIVWPEIDTNHLPWSSSSSDNAFVSGTKSKTATNPTTLIKMDENDLLSRSL